MTQQNEQEQSAAVPGQAAASSPSAGSADVAAGSLPGGAGPVLSGADPAQPAAGGQPAPALPSPYLDAGESVPQAYLAPPQPGQPRYGAPPYPPGRRAGARPGYQQPGNGQGGNGQSGYAQPGAGQPGAGQPGAGRPGIRLGATTRRDPALAPPWQRLVASTLDWTIIIVVSVIAFWSQLSAVWREVQAVSGRYPDLTSPAAQAAINSISRNPANQHALLYWFLGIFGIALVYYWVQHAAWGATIGKRALGIRVVRAADRSRVGVLAAGIRTVTFLVGPAAFLLLTSPINVAGGVLWAADAGLPVLDSRAQSLHDKLAGTVVVRQRSLEQRSRPGAPW